MFLKVWNLLSWFFRNRAGATHSGGCSREKMWSWYTNPSFVWLCELVGSSVFFLTQLGKKFYPTAGRRVKKIRPKAGSQKICPAVSQQMGCWRAILRPKFEGKCSKARLEPKKFPACGGQYSRVVFLSMLQAHLAGFLYIAAKRRNFFGGKNRREAAKKFSG